MAVIKATDLAYGRMRAPDLDAMEEFLTHFGMVRADRTRTALYMRGTDPAHHIHVAELGEPKVIGIAFHAANEDDLARLARVPGASAVEAIDEPGGGKRVRLTDPNGYQVEVVAGMERLAPITVPRDHTNSGEEPLRRAGRVLRLPPSPAPIKRIGHAVFGTPKVGETVRWYRETIGLIASDDIYVERQDNLIGSFNRLDRGSEYVDHHVLFCVNNEKTGLNHLSYEVPDIDAVMKDHQYLMGLNKYQHMWGVGRHLLGSQVYDYWADPWGRVHERWADTDRLNAANGSNLLTPEQGFQSQWGDRPPPRFIGHVSP
jgi:catechol 2,3-dioxygenase-like lactoylglutathione lyase family enzyme